MIYFHYQKSTARFQIVNSVWLGVGCLDMIEIALEEAYVNENIPLKQLNSQKDDSETLFLEINLHLRKWLIIGAYKSPDQSKSVFLESLSKSLFIYLDTCENVILLGDFNMTPEDKNLQLFADPFNLEHLIRKPACFKGSPPCIDLIITNRKSIFQKNMYIRNWNIRFS